MTQLELADFFNVQQSFISAIENGKSPIPQHFMDIIEKSDKIIPDDYPDSAIGEYDFMQQSVKQRIIEYLKFKRISKLEFANAIGVSHSYLTSMRKGMPTTKLALVQSNFPDLNIEWLVTGRGSMLNTPNPNPITMSNSGAITGNGNNVNVLSYGSIPNVQEEKVEALPVIPKNVYQEPAIDIYKYVKDNVSQTSPVVHQFPRFDMWYSVYSDAMAPLYNAGDKLALLAYPQGQEQVLNGRTYVVDTYANGLILCKLTKEEEGYIARYVDEEHYKPDFIKFSDVIRIFKVVGRISVNQ